MAEQRTTFQFSLKRLILWTLVWSAFLFLMRATEASVIVAVGLGVYLVGLAILTIFQKLTASEWTVLVMIGVVLALLLQPAKQFGGRRRPPPPPVVTGVTTPQVQGSSVPEAPTSNNGVAR